METDKKDYKIFYLSESANDYLKYILDYPKKMPELLRQIKDINKTTKTTYLPIGTDKKIIEDRYQGGAIASRGPTFQWLVKKIQAFLSIDNNKVVIWEHGAAKKTDPWIARAKSTCFSYYNDEVYLFAKYLSDKKFIEDTIKHAEVAWRLLGIMTSLSADYQLLPQELNDELFQILVNNTEHIFISAFDGEGYILFTFEDADPLPENV